MANLNEIRNYIEQSQEEHVAEIDKLLTDMITRVGEEFYAKYPNHTVGFMDGMGTYFWLVNDEILDEHIEGRMKTIMQPLLDAHQLYEDVVWVGGRKMYGINHDIKIGE